MKSDYSSPDDIGKIIRRLRLEKGLSQVQLAQRSHVAQSVISYIESGGKKPKHNTVVALIQALDIPVANIFPYYSQSTISLKANETESPVIVSNNYDEEYELEKLLDKTITFAGKPLTNKEKNLIVKILKELRTD